MSTPITSKQVILESNGTTFKYNLTRMSPFRIMALSARITKTLLPVLSGLKVGMSEQMSQVLGNGGITSILKMETKDLASLVKFDAGKSIEAMCASLGDLDEATVEALFIDLFSGVQLKAESGDLLPLDRVSMGITTGYDMGLMVRLAVEVLEFNQFPFGLGAGARKLHGLATRLMSGFAKQTEAELETPSD